MVQAQELRRSQRRVKGASAPLGVAALFILPAFALFVVFLLYPLLTALTSAFFTWQGATMQGFAGLDNFVTLFTKLPYKTAIPTAFVHNLLFFVGAMALQNTVGLFVAVQLLKRPRMRRALQTMYAMPYLVSPLVIGYLWSLLLSPNFGPINALLNRVGLHALALPWLGQPNLALGSVVVIAAWQWIGFPVLLYGSALAGQPADYREAAAIDGASEWKVFRSITLPLLSPAIGTVSVLTFIYAMEIFPLVYALGGSAGSPAGGTDVLALLFYRTSFQASTPNTLGESSAVATLMFVLIFGTAVVANLVFRRMERRLS